LLAKLQEKRGGNQQIQLIKEEPHGEDPRVIVITQGGIVTREDRVIQGKTTKESGVRKATEKTQEFDPRKEKQIFEEARKEFGRD
jgi:F420-0:gamma-glutamyl ligase